MSARKSSQPTAASIKNPHLAQQLAAIKAVTAEFEAMRSRLSPAQLTWKPAAKRWSIAEIAEHLFVTNGLYMARLQETVARAPRYEHGHDQPYRPSLLPRVFIGMLQPQVKLRLRTIKIFEPQSGGDPRAVDNFLRQQTELAGLIAQADGRELNHVKLSSPATRWLRFSIGDTVRMLAVHEQRHLGQAQRLLASEQFPEA